MAAEETLHELYTQITTCADKSKELATVEKLMEAVKASSTTKQLGASMIPKVVKLYSSKMEEGMDLMFDLCEDDHDEVRKKAILNLPVLCENKENCAKIASILGQLLMSDDEAEKALVKSALHRLLGMDVCKSLISLLGHLKTNESVKDEVEFQTTVFSFLEEAVFNDGKQAFGNRLRLRKQIKESKIDRELLMKRCIDILPFLDEKMLKKILTFLADLVLLVPKGEELDAFKELFSSQFLQTCSSMAFSECIAAPNVLKIRHFSGFLKDISFSRPISDFFTKIGVQKLNEIGDHTVRKRILMTLAEHAGVVDRAFAKEALPVIYSIFESCTDSTSSDTSVKLKKLYITMECVLSLLFVFGSKTGGFVNSLLGYQIETGQLDDIPETDTDELWTKYSRALEYIRSFANAYHKALNNVVKTTKVELNEKKTKGEKVDDLKRKLESLHQGIRCCSNLNTIVARLSNRKKPGFLLNNSMGVQKLSWISPSSAETTHSNAPKRDRQTLNESTNTRKRRRPNRAKGFVSDQHDHRG